MLDSISSGTSDSLGLRRTLGFWDGVCVIISIIIGSGIFASPGTALNLSGSPAASLMAWSLSGVLSMAASLCYAELGSLIPKTGGDFEYLKSSYGDEWAFSFIWFNFWVSQPGAMAIIAITFGNYMVTLFIGLDESTSTSTPSKMAAILLICILAGVNCRCVKESSWFNNCLTSAKVVMIVCIVLAGGYYGITRDSIVSENLDSSESFEGSSVTGFGPAMVACLWAFSGWQSVNFLAEEVIDFERRISYMVICAVSTITVLFVLANIAYICALSAADIVDADAVAIDFGKVVSGNFFAGFFALGVALSTAGSLHGTILIAARALYAASRSGHVHKCFSVLNDAGSPYVAVIAQCLWAVILVLLPGSDFNSLLNYTGPANWFYYALTGSTMFYFRYKEPGRRRPYSAFLYPLPPIILIVMSGYIVISSFVQAPLYVGLAFVFIVVSFPVRWLSAVSGSQSADYSSDEERKGYDTDGSAPPSTDLLPRHIELSSSK